MQCYWNRMSLDWKLQCKDNNFSTTTSLFCAVIKCRKSFNLPLSPPPTPTPTPPPAPSSSFTDKLPLFYFPIILQSSFRPFFFFFFFHPFSSSYFRFRDNHYWKEKKKKFAIHHKSQRESPAQRPLSENDRKWQHWEASVTCRVMHCGLDVAWPMRAGRQRSGVGGRRHSGAAGIPQVKQRKDWREGASDGLHGLAGHTHKLCCNCSR